MKTSEDCFSLEPFGKAVPVLSYFYRVYSISTSTSL